VRGSRCKGGVVRDSRVRRRARARGQQRRFPRVVAARAIAAVGLLLLRLGLWWLLGTLEGRGGPAAGRIGDFGVLLRRHWGLLLLVVLLLLVLLLLPVMRVFV